MGCVCWFLFYFLALPVEAEPALLALPLRKFLNLHSEAILSSTCSFTQQQFFAVCLPFSHAHCTQVPCSNRAVLHTTLRIKDRWAKGHAPVDLPMSRPAHTVIYWVLRTRSRSCHACTVVMLLKWVICTRCSRRFAHCHLHSSCSLILFFAWPLLSRVLVDSLASRFHCHHTTELPALHFFFFVALNSCIPVDSLVSPTLSPCSSTDSSTIIIHFLPMCLLFRSCHVCPAVTLLGQICTPFPLIHSHQRQAFSVTMLVHQVFSTRYSFLCR